MLVTYRSSPEDRTSRGELIEEALCRLLAPDKAEVPSGPAAETARQEIEKICAGFAQAGASPHIGEARQALQKMADDATALARRIEQNARMLEVGAATFNPADTAERSTEKQEEIQSAQDELLATARELDRVAEMLRERIARWAGKETGKLSSAYQMIHGDPGQPLAEAAAQLFAQHRPNDLHASVTGNFYMFIRLLYEAAIGHKPKEYELLSACRHAVKAVPAKR